MSGNSMFLTLREAGGLSLKRVRVAPAERITALALALCILGWTLLWAQALSVVELLPQWLCAAVFFTGIALIPLCRRTPRERSAKL